jgi:hypothetical protein
MGDRFDFKRMRITETGGIYVRTFPAAGQITIDSNISQKPGLFANSIFVQSLLPKDHTVFIQKDGYYDYFKTLPVVEKEVTKLENVLLIKKSIEFKSLVDKVDYFSIAPNNQSFITFTTGAKSTTLNYSSLSSSNLPQTLSFAQLGKILSVKWSGDSNKALISALGGPASGWETFYYLFDNASQSQAAVKKPTVARIASLDKTTQQISFNPQDSQQIFFIKNKNLYSLKNNKTTPIITGLLSYKISGNNITWLSSNGMLSSSDMSGKLISALTEKNITTETHSTSSGQAYQIFNFSGKIFLSRLGRDPAAAGQSDSALSLLNQNTKKLEDITPPLINYKILDSLDENKNLNLIFWNSEKIYLYSFKDKKFTELFSGSSVNNCQWINNNYIIFTQDDKIIISEIDYRGNINAITLPQTAPKIYFNQQDGKLYILKANSLLSSDKITP